LLSVVVIFVVASVVDAPWWATLLALFVAGTALGSWGVRRTYRR
jgi:hypothetical protein